MLKKNFLEYADFYDRLYLDKDYKAEVRFVTKLLHQFQPRAKNLLSLGCGTCNHELLLARKKYVLTAVDQSPQMLEIADKKITQERLNHKIKLLNRNVTQLGVLPLHDSAISLFNVVGYQTTNSAFSKMLSEVSKNLKPGGIFLFDCWYGPAVIKTPPTDRIKDFKDRRSRILRLTQSRLLSTENKIEINFHVLEIAGGKLKRETSESHYMRYWSLPELEMFLTVAGLKLVQTGHWFDLERPVSDHDWNMFVVAQKQI